jgi:hypothetical protein
MSGLIPRMSHAARRGLLGMFEQVNRLEKLDQAEAQRFSLSTNLPQQKPGRVHCVDTGENPIVLIAVLMCALSVSFLFAIVIRLFNVSHRSQPNSRCPNSGIARNRA